MKNDMFKVFVFMFKEFVDEYGVRIYKILEKVGEVIFGFMVFIYVVLLMIKDFIYL